MLLCICLPATAFADANKDKDDDSKYLAGAVPEVDGKSGIHQRIQHSRHVAGRNLQTHTGLDGSAAEEKRKHQSRSLHQSGRRTNRRHGRRMDRIQFECASLDRTKILYQLSVVCAPEKCTMEVEKIRFNYREGKREIYGRRMDSRQYALNKAKTKLVRGLAKWRRKQ